MGEMSLETKAKYQKIVEYYNGLTAQQKWDEMNHYIASLPKADQELMLGLTKKKISFPELKLVGESLQYRHDGKTISMKIVSDYEFAVAGKVLNFTPGKITETWNKLRAKKETVKASFLDIFISSAHAFSDREWLEFKTYLGTTTAGVALVIIAFYVSSLAVLVALGTVGLSLLWVMPLKKLFDLLELDKKHFDSKEASFRSVCSVMEKRIDEQRPNLTEDKKKEITSAIATLKRDLASNTMCNKEHKVTCTEVKDCLVSLEKNLNEKRINLSNRSQKSELMDKRSSKYDKSDEGSKARKD